MVVVGSGIVGLFAALEYKKKSPHKEVVVIDRSPIPQGASTKNAGFACIGSPSELLEDLQNMEEEKVANLIKMRWLGLDRLRRELGDEHIGFQPTGNIELFRKEEGAFADYCSDQCKFLNELMQNAIGRREVFKPYVGDKLGPIALRSRAILNSEEGLIDTGKMMRTLLAKTLGCGVLILNGRSLLGYEVQSQGVEVFLEGDMALKSEKMLICTNAFGETPKHWPERIEGFRNQVFVYNCPSHGIPDYGYHMDKGYLYFRTLGKDHLLIGGGRNKFLSKEATKEFGNTPEVEKYLRDILEELMSKTLPQPQNKWSGILASGESKIPIVKKINERVGVAVRLGGMGVAIGSLIGSQGAQLMAGE